MSRLSRRSFIYISLAMLYGAAAAPSSVAGAVLKSARDDSGSAVAAGALPIMQGPTGPDTTLISIVALKTKPVSAVLREEGSLRDSLEAAQTTTRQRIDSDYAVQIFTFTGLQLNVRYVLEVRDSASGQLVDSRIVKALDTSKATVKWGFFSCVRDLLFPKEQKATWNEFLSHKLDFIISVGDNVYVDDGPEIPGEEFPTRMWRRYVEVRQAFEIFKTRELVPYLATWDDHDFGANDSTDEFPYKREAKEIFKSFFPQIPIPGVYEMGPGVASYMRAGGQRFYLMDDRSWRSAKHEKPVTHWGAEQEKWLFQHLDASREPAWLLNGSQFFGGYMPGESYEANHYESFRNTIDTLKKVKAPVVFGGGDRHMSELMRIEPLQLGYETFEITSSGMLTKTIYGRWLAYPNRRQIDGNDTKRTYNIIESTAQKNGVKFNVSAWKPGLLKSYGYDLQIKKPVTEIDAESDDGASPDDGQ